MGGEQRVGAFVYFGHVYFFFFLVFVLTKHFLTENLDGFASVSEGLSFNQKMVGHKPVWFWLWQSLASLWNASVGITKFVTGNCENRIIVYTWMEGASRFAFLHHCSSWNSAVPAIVDSLLRLPPHTHINQSDLSYYSISHMLQY